jgi:putative oxidoreductase
MASIVLHVGTRHGLAVDAARRGKFAIPSQRTAAMNAAAQQDAARLILRLVLGICILMHGIAKIRHGVGGIEGMLVARGLPGVLSWGALIGEVLGPIMVLAGWHARIGAALIAINMLFAIFLVHMGQLFALDPQTGGWAIELQAMFLFTAVALALLGPGRFSLNQK